MLSLLKSCQKLSKCFLVNFLIDLTTRYPKLSSVVFLYGFLRHILFHGTLTINKLQQITFTAADGSKKKKKQPE